ncbi:MAG TPA: hypothetical protein VFB93_07235 [Burkholderiales bacterium]|nr:hypothetical protein [Burkholderiales bacterium]
MRDIIIAACGIAVVALLAVLVYQNYQRFHKPLLTTTYQALTLVNGEVFYGRIDHLGTDHPVLRDAFTVRIEQDAQSQKSRYVIARRVDSPTGADHMVFPATAIVSIEPVRPDSEVGRLMQSLKK